MRKRPVVAVGIALLLTVLLAPFPPAAAEGTGEELLIDTVGLSVMAQDFTVNPVYAPQIGQSFAITSPVLASRITLTPSEVSIAKKLEWVNSRYDVRHYTYLHRNRTVPATTTLNIWRHVDGSPFPDAIEPPEITRFDVATNGFENVYSKTYATPVSIGRPFTLAIDPPLVLPPGTYLAAWYFTFPNKRIYGVRFWGEQHGNSHWTLDGNTFLHSDCVYKPHPDSSPAGTAAYTADQWAPPGGLAPAGPAPGTIGYSTWFRPASSKTSGCHGCPQESATCLKGVLYDVANQGDLDMQIVGRFVPVS